MPRATIIPSTFGLLGAVVAFTPTVREVIQLFIQYTHLTYTFFHASLEEEEGRGRLTSSPTAISAGCIASISIASLVRLETARNFWPDSYRQIVGGMRLDYPEPVETRTIARLRLSVDLRHRAGGGDRRLHATIARAATNPLGLGAVAGASARLRDAQARAATIVDDPCAAR